MGEVNHHLGFGPVDLVAVVGGFSILGGFEAVVLVVVATGQVDRVGGTRIGTTVIDSVAVRLAVGAFVLPTCFFLVGQGYQLGVVLADADC